MSKALLPTDFTECGMDDIMSNFDHSIADGIAEHIKGKPLFSRYAGWNFNGQVWWDGAWNCDVYVYGSCLKTVRAETLREIMDSVCAEFGFD